MLMASRRTGVKAFVKTGGIVLVLVAAVSLTYLAYEMAKTGHGMDTFDLPTSRGSLWRTYASWLVDVFFAAAALLAVLVASFWYRYRSRPMRRAKDE